MSFLAYVLRAYKDRLSEYQEMIPDFVIRLLQDCPPEASATRKVKNISICILGKNLNEFT